MTEKTAQSVANLGYHAHIYYGSASARTVAERVCAALSGKFPVEVEGFRGMIPVTDPVKAADFPATASTE